MGRQTGRCRRADGGVLDALMEHALKHRRKGAAYFADVLQRQGRVVQLTVVDLAPHQFGDELLDGLGRGIGHGTDGSLHRVRQHDDGAFLGLGTAAVVAEIGNVHSLPVRLLQRLMVEVHHRRVAVMLDDDILNFLRQMILLGQHHAVPGMGGDNGGGNIGIGMLVRIFAQLVFLKVHGALQFADVVVIGSRAAQQGIGPHRFRRRLGQIGHDDGVVIGAGGFDHQPAQNGLIGVGQLQQLGRGRQTEHRLHQRVQRDAQHRRHHGGQGAPQGVVHHHPHGVVSHKADGEDDDHIGKAGQEAAQQHLLAVGLPMKNDDHQKAGDKRNEQKVHDLRSVAGIAARQQRADQHRQGETTSHARPGADQAGEHHHAQQCRGQIGVDLLSQHTRAHGQAQHQHHQH